ncbi:MAG: hypothetical protein AAB276_03740 [Pseudomonadota bacterium]
MKGKLLVFFSLGLLVMNTIGAAPKTRAQRSTERANADVVKLGKDVLFGAITDSLPIPNNVNTKTGIIAGAGVVMMVGSGYIADLLVGKDVNNAVGTAIETVLANNVGANDLVKATLRLVGGCGVLGVYDDPTLQAKFVGSTAALFLAQQTANPHVIVKGEACDAVLKGFMGLSVGQAVGPLLQLFITNN